MSLDTNLINRCENEAVRIVFTSLSNSRSKEKIEVEPEYLLTQHEPDAATLWSKPLRGAIAFTAMSFDNRVAFQ